MLATLILVALLAYVNHVAWELHKKGDYDKAVLWFCGMLVFWWAVIGATFGPISVTEEQTITAEPGLLFLICYLGAVVAACVMAAAEWIGHSDISYKVMFFVVWLLPASAIFRLFDMMAAINKANI